MKLAILFLSSSWKQKKIEKINIFSQNALSPKIVFSYKISREAKKTENYMGHGEMLSLFNSAPKQFLPAPSVDRL